MGGGGTYPVQMGEGLPQGTCPISQVRMGGGVPPRYLPPSQVRTGGGGSSKLGIVNLLTCALNQIDIIKSIEINLKGILVEKIRKIIYMYYQKS